MEDVDVFRSPACLEVRDADGGDLDPALSPGPVCPRVQTLLPQPPERVHRPDGDREPQDSFLIRMPGRSGEGPAHLLGENPPDPRGVVRRSRTADAAYTLAAQQVLGHPVIVGGSVARSI